MSVGRRYLSVVIPYVIPVLRSSAEWRRFDMVDRWDEINQKIEEVVRLIESEGLTMVEATFGTDDNINNWQYKIWIPKSKQRN